MKVLYGLVVSTLISISAFSQTNVGGTIVSDTEWTLAGSPYTLMSTVGITAGVTLTIHPGVQVNGNFDLVVKGKVLINGTSAQPVDWNNARLIFKSADLSLSAINDVHFRDVSRLQLADEAEHNEDLIKNSNTLTVKHCSFSSGSSARTKGYATTAKLRLEDCTFNNATVFGYYPRSERIELENAVIISSTLESDSYNYGIHIRNSSVTQSSFRLGCCDANFDISDTDIQNSSFTHHNNYNAITLNRVTLTNTYLNTPYANVTISDCKFYASSIPETTLIQMASGSITNSTLEGNAALTLVNVISYYPSNLTIENVNFKNYNVGLVVNGFNSIRIKSNNFINGTSFNTKNFTNKNIDATNNYWGTVDEQIIKNKIWDLYDDINYGIVDYNGFTSSPFSLNPLQKPTALRKGLHTQGTFVRWTKLTDPTITGYRIYKKTGANYTLVNNAGINNSMLVSESYSTDFVVTAYNALADGTNDQQEGYESPFSDISIPFLELSQSNSTTVCESKSVQLDFTPNYDFDPTTSFLLVVSRAVDFADSDTIQIKSPAGVNNFLLSLSEPLSSDQTLYYRIGSNEFDIFSEALPIQVIATPEVHLTIDAGCNSGAYNITLPGLQADVDLNWSLDGGTISEIEPGKFLATWTTAGEKTITLTASRNTCDVVVTKTLNVSLTNALPSPAICSIEFDESSGNNKLSWQYTNGNFSAMKIYREGATNEFELIATVPSAEQSYLDVTSEAAARAYRYRISANDNCGKETDLSDVAMSLHLQLGQAPDGNWNLSWEQRVGLNNLEIYRQTAPKTWNKIGTLSTIHTSFTDTESPSGNSLYQARVAGSASCLISSNIVSNGILSTETENLNFRAHPNPVVSKLTFYYPTKGEYALMSIGGLPVLTGTVEAGENNISVSSLSQGLYVLKVWSGKQQSVTKVVK